MAQPRLARKVKRGFKRACPECGKLLRARRKWLYPGNLWLHMRLHCKVYNYKQKQWDASLINLSSSILAWQPGQFEEILQLPTEQAVPLLIALIRQEAA
jgi:hypothetical protein